MFIPSREQGVKPRNNRKKLSLYGDAVSQEREREREREEGEREGESRQRAPWPLETQRRRLQSAFNIVRVNRNHHSRTSLPTAFAVDIQPTDVTVWLIPWVVCLCMSVAGILRLNA